MRSILNTTLALGLVRIPVKVYSATSSHDRAMHQHHASDGGRIRYEKVCEIEEEPVPAEEIVKGVEVDDEVILLDDDDLAALPQSTSREIEVLSVVPSAQIDPIYYEKTYYLGPGGKTDPYVLLREALHEAERTALVRFTMRQRESLAAVRVRGDVLVLETMLWPDEIVIPKVEGVGGEVVQEELEMARILIDARSGDWEPERYTDEYQEALAELIEAKREGRPAPKAAPERKAKVINLMDALKKSVEQADPDRLPAKKTVRKSAKKSAKKTARASAAKKPAKAASRRKSS
ncbi:non-homologous end joining protein Ku [Glycomyces albidus]|jgi:DNA end-binding protein Ku|uniref:Non-homologous end joining protein Ku n=1 Tax=Glycomyces albidus TaxID=2656774 RepID=A0A6L5GD23_9ACTN|nr:Ku protein [Glycomyces albidus]MQM27373.1 Ku protein [Glycomyces albidus]